MKEIIYILSITVLFVCQVFAQSRTLCSLPAHLSENSGLLAGANHTVWMHNDGGNAAELYQVDTTGTVLRTIMITNATNVDWEDMTKDASGNVYVGDFGNNNNNRQNLKIYKIPSPDSILSNTVQAEIISFSYPQQQNYPAQDAEKKYDAESLIFFQNQLYIFTKDRTTPHLGYTWVYRIPSQAGQYAAQLIDSFQTQQLSYVFEVTSAAVSPDGRHLVLLNALGLWLFSDFVGDDFFSAQSQFISLNNFSQKEAVGFVDAQNIYISNESSWLGGAQLATLDISVYDNTVLSSTVITASPNSYQIYPNPIDDIIHIKVLANHSSTIHCSLFDNKGMMLKKMQPQQLIQGVQHFSYPMQDLPTGMYYLKIETETEAHSSKIIKL